MWCKKIEQIFLIKFRNLGEKKVWFDHNDLKNAHLTKYLKYIMLKK